MSAARLIDYTQMELGTVTWRGRRGRTRVIARCVRCGRRGQRTVLIPDELELHLNQKPRVTWDHKAVHKHGPIGSYVEIVEHCRVAVDKTNVDDLLNVAERKLYDAFVAQLRQYVDQF